MGTVNDRILYNIQKNGFPEKRVSLPFGPILKAGKEEGIKLSDLLKELEENGVFHTMKDDKIIFHNKEAFDNEEDNKTGTIQGNQFGIPDAMYKQAMEQIEKMDPDQLREIQERVKNMSPEEMANLFKMFEDFK